jgi:hypothetical protein
MKTGRATLFAQCVIHHQVKYGLQKFTTWEEFRDAFIVEFCLKFETGLAIAKLEMEKYYQGKRSVDEYVDEFRELVKQARYSQGLVIVIKFRRGLDKEIQDVITNIPIGCPVDDNAESWYKVAIQADENRTANDLFHSGRQCLLPDKPHLMANALHHLHTTESPNAAKSNTDGHRHDSKKTQQVRYLLALQKSQTLGKGL